MKNIKFRFENWANILSHIYNIEKQNVGKLVTSSSISKDLDITFSHVATIVGQLKKMKFVSCFKQGRVVEIELTSRGLDIGFHLTKAKELLNKK